MSGLYAQVLNPRRMGRFDTSKTSCFTTAHRSRCMMGWRSHSRDDLQPSASSRRAAYHDVGSHTFLAEFLSVRAARIASPPCFSGENISILVYECWPIQPKEGASQGAARPGPRRDRPFNVNGGTSTTGSAAEWVASAAHAVASIASAREAPGPQQRYCGTKPERTSTSYAREASSAAARLKESPMRGD